MQGRRELTTLNLVGSLCCKPQKFSTMIKKTNLSVKGHFNDMSTFSKTGCAIRIQLTPTLNEKQMKPWHHCLEVIL